MATSKQKQATTESLDQAVANAPDGSTVLPADVLEENGPQDEAAEVSAPVMTDDDIRKAKSEVYSATTTWLRETHRDEFNAHMKAELGQRGIEWHPTPTKAERAAEDIRRLAAEHGIDLSALLAQDAEQGPVEEPADG